MLPFASAMRRSSDWTLSLPCHVAKLVVARRIWRGGDAGREMGGRYEGRERKKRVCAWGKTGIRGKAGCVMGRTVEACTIMEITQLQRHGQKQASKERADAGIRKGVC